MNTKKGKIELLKAVANGEIDIKNLTSMPVIVSNGKETFSGLMVSVAAKKSGNENPVIYVGEAKELIESCLANVKTKRNEH